MGYSSQAGQVILRTQTAEGTYEPDTGTDGVAIRLRSGTLGPNRELMIPDPEIGGGRDTVDAYLGTASWGGDYEFYARVDSLTTLLKAALGLCDTATTSGVTTNTITPDDTSDFHGLSIEERIGSGLECFNYTDAVVNTLHLEAEANGYLQGTAGLIAAKQEAGKTPTATPVWDDTPLYVGTNIVLTYGGVSMCVQNFSLDINNNYADDAWCMGGFYLGDLTAAGREITAGFTIREEDSDLWKQAVYGASSATAVGGITTKQALVITATAYEDIVGSTPLTKYSIAITIPKFILTPYAFAVSGDDVIDDDLEGRAVRPAIATPIMTVVTKTGKAEVS